MKQEKLKQLIKERGISINRLAIESNIASPDMYLIISGKKPFYPNWRKRVAAYLQVDESEIFDK